jgi:hypothetical protein
LLGFCVKALPAALLEADAERPSDKVLEAEDAAFEPVFLLGALCCDRALPAEDLEWLSVSLFLRVFDAALAAGFEVVSLFAMAISVRMEPQNYQGAE